MTNALPTGKERIKEIRKRVRMNQKERRKAKKYKSGTFYVVVQHDDDEIQFLLDTYEATRSALQRAREALRDIADKDAEPHCGDCGDIEGTIRMKLAAEALTDISTVL